MLPTWTYATSPDAIYVNLFIGSTVTVEKVAGTDVQLVQATNYPWTGKVSITVNPRARKRFAIRIRVPNRNVSALYRSEPDSSGIMSLSVNGESMKATIENGYAAIARTWKAGDTIEVVLPMKVQRVRASEEIAADRGRVALRFGPLVYNIEQVDQGITKTLGRNSALSSEWDANLLGGVVVVKGTFADGTPLMAVPNYARHNRTPPLPPPPPAPTPAPGAPPARPPQPPATSIVWIKEATS